MKLELKLEVLKQTRILDEFTKENVFESFTDR